MSGQQPQIKKHPDDSEDKILSRFLDRLGKLSTGELAILKRNAGSTISESHGALGLFYKILPSGQKVQRDEEIFFLVASLKGLNRYSFTGNFGATLHRLKLKTGSDNIDRRMKLMLDSNFNVLSNGRNGGGALPHRLHQYVKLAASKEIGVDWKQLLRDLRRWSHPERFIQKQWARSYFGAEDSQPAPNTQDESKTENSRQTD